MHHISQLYIYPVKSLGGFEVSSAPLTLRGLQYDRRFMLVDTNNHFLTQREYPIMSLLQTAIEVNELIIYPKNNPADKIVLPLHPETGVTNKVKVWDDTCDAEYVSDRADNWFSNHLAMQCRLVYMPDRVQRKVDTRYAHKNEITSFADDYPLLMIGQASLDDLNSRLLEALPMDRFRPNIVFTGGRPYDEDVMEHILVNNINLYGVKLCARCVITTINQANARKAKEPVRTLTEYRMSNNKIYFGQNMLLGQTGFLKVGDAIEIIKTKPAALFNVTGRRGSILQGD
ncbi:MAG: MOSC N-terminal beta barrel domain-containing protein [Ferruginibacter sp.]